MQLGITCPDTVLFSQNHSYIIFITTKFPRAYNLLLNNAVLLNTRDNITETP